MEVCTAVHLPIRGQLDFDKITICAMPAPSLQYVKKAITILVAPHDIVGYNVCTAHWSIDLLGCLFSDYRKSAKYKRYASN